MISELDQDEFNELYQSIVLEHSKKPRNFGTIKGNKTSHGKNPNCGDTIDVFLDVENNIINDISFTGQGCALCISSASMLIEKIKHLSTEDGLKLIHDFSEFIKNKSPLNEDLEPLHIFSHIHNFPLRVKCVLLAPKTIENALTK